MKIIFFINIDFSGMTMVFNFKTLNEETFIHFVVKYGNITYIELKKSNT